MSTVPQQSTPVPQPPTPHKKHKVRKMTLALWAWTIGCVVWAVAGGSSTNCAQYGDPNYQTGCQAGTAIGVGLIIGLWFIVFVVLSLIWFMTKPNDR